MVRNTKRSKRSTPPPQLAPPPPPPSGHRASFLDVIRQGFGFGTGSALAHAAVGSVIGASSNAPLPPSANRGSFLSSDPERCVETIERLYQQCIETMDDRYYCADLRKMNSLLCSRMDSAPAPPNQK